MLSSFIWDARYSVGHPLLDDQHKKLLQLCQLAAASLAKPGRGKEEFHRILGDLAEFAREHFATEEALLKAWGYPERDAHIREHRDYEERLMQILILAADGTTGIADLYSYVITWWTEHVLKTDFQYAPYLQESPRI